MATPYFANGFNLGHPTLSPDGRWMAYDSDESGQGVDVFIQSFPDPNQKRQKVSPVHGQDRIRRIRAGPARAVTTSRPTASVFSSSGFPANVHGSSSSSTGSKS